MIAHAKACQPLPDDKRGESTIGFHHGVILGLADKVIEAVSSGAIKHFYLIGGCDGALEGATTTRKSPIWRCPSR